MSSTRRIFPPIRTPKLAAGVATIGLLLVAAGCSAPTSEVAPDEPRAETQSPQQMTHQYPESMRQEIIQELFGQAVHDPYRWLENVDEDAVQEWMGAQDTFARDYLEQLDARDALEARFKELFYVDVLYSPAVHGGRYFYARRSADKEKAVYYWKEGEEGEEKVLLDPNQMSEDGSTSVRGIFPSHDGKKVAYKLSENNADAATLYVKDVATGEVSEIDVIPNARYAYPSWTPDNRGFYYTYLPETFGPDEEKPGEEIPVDERPGYAEVRFHLLGEDPAEDPLIRERTGDARTFLGAQISRDGKWLIATVAHGWNNTDVFYQALDPDDSEAPGAAGALDAWEPFILGEETKYSVWAWEDYFYIFSDEDAPNARIFRASVDKPAREDWQEIVATDEERVLNDVDLVGGKLVLNYLVDAHNVLEVRELDGEFIREVELPGLGASWGMKGQPDLDEAYYAFESFTTPMTIFKTSISSGESTLWEELDMPVDPSPYTVSQVWYPSKDGTEISMFVVHRKDIELDGQTPFLLYGYGGFSVNMLPNFRSSIYPWLDAGGGYAIPNLRGGGEYGEAWHRAGMRANKQNVFDDFIAAAEYLIDEGYTAADRLAISGGSNGGLLVGAATVQRPELFRAVICSVPLLDMVRYHKFGSGKTWISEYGDPDIEEEFEYIYAYSPYHHIAEGAEYPALLMQSADSDDRVDPMHARKFVASMQHANASEHPILLRIEEKAGHGGGDMIKKTVARYADEYAFLMAELGLSVVVDDSPENDPTDGAEDDE